MTPTQRRLAKLEQDRPTATGSVGMAFRLDGETRAETIAREFGDGPVPDTLIWIIGVKPTHGFE